MGVWCACVLNFFFFLFNYSSTHYFCGEHQSYCGWLWLAEPHTNTHTVSLPNAVRGKKRGDVGSRAGILLWWQTPLLHVIGPHTTYFQLAVITWWCVSDKEARMSDILFIIASQTDYSVHGLPYFYSWCAPKCSDSCRFQWDSISHWPIVRIPFHQYTTQLKWADSPVFIWHKTTSSESEKPLDCTEGDYIGVQGQPGHLP